MISVRKSQQKNAFWIHNVRINEEEQALFDSEDNPQQPYNELPTPDEAVTKNGEESKRHTACIFVQKCKEKGNSFSQVDFGRA